MMLKKNNTLKQLHLTGCGPQPEGLEEVMKGVQVNTKLETLSLLENTIDNKRASCLDTANFDGQTPLMSACLDGHEEVVRTLLSADYTQVNKQTKDGETALHMAVKGGHRDCVRILLSIPGIDPNLVNHKGQTPLKLANNYELLTMLQKYTTSCENFPVHTYGKVILCGNSGAGKSTLTQAIMQFMSEDGGADQHPARKIIRKPVKAAGIISHVKGQKANMIIYDLAGHGEYYSSHSSILERISNTTPSIFLLLVNLLLTIKDITAQLYFWSAMIGNVCSNCSQPSSIIVVGTHIDCISDEGKLEFLHTQIEQVARDAIKQHNFVQFTALNVTSVREQVFGSFLSLLHGTIDEVRRRCPAISLTCHVMYAFLNDKVPADQDAISMSQLLTLLSREKLKVLPTDATEVSKHLQVLSDKGFIIFFESDTKHVDSWIVFRPEALLEKVNEVLFAPSNFREHLPIASNTGVIPISILKCHFPEPKYNIDMITQFLVRFELCQPITLTPANATSKKPPSSSCPDLFFPHLVSASRPDDVTIPDNAFIWQICTTYINQSFSPRFLHVLVSRTVNQFPLPTVEPYLVPALKPYSCTVWSRGISWISKEGFSTVIEMREDFQCLLCAVSTSDKTNIEYSKLILSVINEIKVTCDEFCPSVSRVELITCPPEATSDHVAATVECDTLKEILLQAGKVTVTDSSRKKQVNIIEWRKVEPQLSLLIGVDQKQDGHTAMSKCDHAKIYQTTESASDKWRAIGRKLGFTVMELDTIVHEPGRNGDEDYYEAMLRRWLDWAPPNHTPPSLQSLLSALRAAGKERQANNLAAKYKVCGHTEASTGDDQSPLSEEYISAEEDPSILVGVQNKGEYSAHAPPPLVDLHNCTKQKHKDEVDKYPLHTAVKEGNIVLIRQLIEKGADLNEFDNSHMTALDVATRNRNKKVMDLLIIEKQSLSTTNKVANITNLNHQDPFVAVLFTTFNTSTHHTSLYRGIASKALASPSHRYPIKASDDSGYYFLEQKKKSKQRVKDLQTRQQDLLRLQSKQDNGKQKDTKVEKQAQCQKTKNLKRKMELFSNEAKQTSQRLSADNYQLREEIRQEVHHHELIGKSIEGEAKQLELKMSSTSVRMRAVQRAVENMGEMDQKSLKTIPCLLDLHLPHLKQTVKLKSLVHVIISGLPSFGKSHILNHLFFNEDTKTQVTNEESDSVRETILTSDGHSWKWMQVSKSEADALAVGTGISQAYAKEGHSPDFVIPEESSMDTIPRIVKEKASQFNNFTSIKELSMINVWDIGANKIPFDLLPLLLPRSKRLVVLSVVSLDSDAGDMHSHMHEGKNGQEVPREPYSKLDYLMAPPSIARCGTMVVGTHTGKLPRDRLRARQRTVERLIRANAEEMGIGKTLYPRCIAVDTSNQGDIVKIRNALEKVAVNNREYSVEIPLIWVCLHGNLVSECKSWYITKETLCHFAKQLGIINQQDVEKWLNVYSKCGSIIYFDETTLLHNYIILKPGIFFSKVQKLYAGANEAGHGRVHELANQLLQKEDSEFLLNIFEHLGLMVRADDISAGSSTGKLMKYYMPSLCPECITSPIAEALSSLFVILSRASLSPTHLAKFVQFTKVLPSLEGIKYVVNEVHQYWNQLHLQLYSGPQLADVKICIEDNHLEVKIACALQGTDGDQMLHKACSLFKTVIVDFFQHISKEGSDLQYELSLLCPPSLRSPRPHFISFHPLDKEDAGNRGMLFCGCCKQDVGIEDSALKWLRADYQGPRSAALKQEEVISTDLIIKLSYELSTITPQQMEGLGCALGCTNTDIEMMLRCSSMQECILSLLQIWVRNYHLPTKERLAQALKRSGCLDKAIRLTSSDNYVPSLLSLEERTMISTQVSEFRKQIEIKDSEAHCCNKVLGLYSKRTDSSNCLIHALVFIQEFQNFVLLLLLKNNAFWMLK